MRVSSAGGGSLNVLVLEGSEEIRRRLVDQIETLARAVVKCATGDPAEALVAASGPIDAIVMDIASPDVQGVDLLVQLRQRAPRARLIIWTLRDPTAYRDRCLELGADVFLDKKSGSVALLGALLEESRTDGDHDPAA